MLLPVYMILGVALARRRLGITQWAECLPLGLALGHLLLLVLSNACLRLGGWSLCSTGLWTGCLVGALLVARRPCPPLPSAGKLPRTMWALAALSLGVACLLQALHIDDDYWIHTPIQGMLAHGDFPPHNFFFPNIQLKGHYGRDLLIALWTLHTGWTTFTSQFVMTSLLQPMQLFLVYWALRRQTGLQAPALWATLSVALAVQVSDRCGLLVVLQNNNAPLHTWWALVLYAFALTWTQRTLNWALVLGVTLGSMAIVYETHFGLSCLASLVTFAFGLAWLPRPGQFLRLGLAVLVTATSLAFTQGGPLTDLAVRRISHAEAEGKPDIGLSTQNQLVTLSFPKQKLWQIRCLPAPNRWVEKLSDSAWLYRTDQMADPNLGYAPWWDPSVLGLHSFPLYLSPLLLAWALRRRQPLCLWLVTFGFFAFFTPALVDFGPVFESEYMRWQFAAGLGFAAALGMAVGPHIEQSVGQRRPIAVVWLFFLIYASVDLRHNAWELWDHWQSARRSGRPTWYWGAHDWVTRQPALDFSEADWQTAQWLNLHCKLGETLLVGPLARPHQVSYESTMTGLTGLKASRRIPLDSDKVGLVPSRQRADVGCFLQTGDPEYLNFTPAEWVLLRSPYPLPSHPQVNWKKWAERCVGRISHPPLNWSTGWSSPLNTQVSIQGLPDLLDEGKVYPIEVNCPSPPQTGRLVIGPRLRGQRHSDPQDWIPYALDSKGPKMWMAPHQAGRYTLEYLWWDPQGLHPLSGGREVTVNTTQRLVQATLESVKIRPSGLGDGWCNVTVNFRAPLSNSRDFVGGAAFVAGAGADAPLAPLLSDQPLELMQNLELRQISPNRWEFQVRALLPPGPGDFRVDILLSPLHGTTLRLRGPLLRVTSEFYPG